MNKAPNPIDKHVGARVRMRRLMVGMSQGKLGEALDVTFQQVQKYEKGSNRIGASRLQQLARVLEVPPSFFFEGAALGRRAVALRRVTEYTFMHTLHHNILCYVIFCFDMHTHMI